MKMVNERPINEDDLFERLSESLKPVTDYWVKQLNFNNLCPVCEGEYQDHTRCKELKNNSELIKDCIEAILQPSGYSRGLAEKQEQLCCYIESMFPEYYKKHLKNVEL